MRLDHSSSLLEILNWHFFGWRRCRALNHRLSCKHCQSDAMRHSIVAICLRRTSSQAWDVREFPLSDEREEYRPGIVSPDNVVHLAQASQVPKLFQLLRTIMLMSSRAVWSSLLGIVAAAAALAMATWEDPLNHEQRTARGRCTFRWGLANSMHCAGMSRRALRAIVSGSPQKPLATAG